MQYYNHNKLFITSYWYLGDAWCIFTFDLNSEIAASSGSWTCSWSVAIYSRFWVSMFVLSTAGHFIDNTRWHFHRIWFTHGLWKWYKYPLCTSLGYLYDFINLVSIISRTSPDIVGTAMQQATTIAPVRTMSNDWATEHQSGGTWIEVVQRTTAYRQQTTIARRARSSNQGSGRLVSRNYRGLWSAVDYNILSLTVVLVVGGVRGGGGSAGGGGSGGVGVLGSWVLVCHPIYVVASVSVGRYLVRALSPG